TRAVSPRDTMCVLSSRRLDDLDQSEGQRLVRPHELIGRAGFNPIHLNSLRQSIAWIRARTGPMRPVGRGLCALKRVVRDHITAIGGGGPWGRVTDRGEQSTHS